MKIQDMDNIKSQDEARQFAIDWQNWQADQKMYMSELAEWQAAFVDLALNWGLAEEFEENGIIQRVDRAPIYFGARLAHYNIK